MRTTKTGEHRYRGTLVPGNIGTGEHIGSGNIGTGEHMYAPGEIYREREGGREGGREEREREWASREERQGERGREGRDGGGGIYIYRERE